LPSDKKYSGDKIKKNKLDKKGLIVTLFIVVGIVGASFIVWFLPQDNIKNNASNNAIMPFSNPNDTLISVNNQYMILKSEVSNQLKNITSGNQTNLTQVKSSIDASIKQNNELMQTLLNGNPSGPLVNQYVTLMNSLKNFSFYLGDIKNVTSSPFSTSSNLTKYFISSEKKWIGG
jgi:hypothetical protein